MQWYGQGPKPKPSCCLLYLFSASKRRGKQNTGPSYVRVPATLYSWHQTLLRVVSAKTKCIHVRQLNFEPTCTTAKTHRQANGLDIAASLCAAAGQSIPDLTLLIIAASIACISTLILHTLLSHSQTIKIELQLLHQNSDPGMARWQVYVRITHVYDDTALQHLRETIYIFSDLHGIDILVEKHQ